MKKLILILLMVGLMYGTAEAARIDNCYWIWSTDVTTANDAPDSVYCSSKGDGVWVSKGTSYIQNSNGADSIDIIYDTTWNNTATVPNIPDTITPCSNTASTGDLNVLTCMDSICSTGTTDVVYHQVNDIADAIKNGFRLTPPTAFKLTVDGDTATCWVVKTSTNWR